MDYSKQFEILNQKVQQIKRQQPVNYTQFSIKNIESTFDKFGKFDSINKELQDRIL